MHPFLLLVFIYIAFVSLGLPDSLLGVAWPTMRATLGVSLEGAGPIAIVLTACSAVSAVTSSFVNRRIGTGPVVALSCALTSIGLLGCSVSPSYLWVLAAALPLGFGQGGVDSSLNAYVAANYASRHMNWLHACWGIGATIGPMVMTQVIVSGFLWRDGYRIIALVQGSLALLFIVFLRLWKRADVGSSSDDSGQGGDAPAGGEGRKISGLRRIEPWIQISMYGIYCAAEISTGIWTASILVEARGFDRGIAGLLVSSYYAGITGGRILTGFVADRIGNRGMVRIGIGTALAGIVLLSFSLPPAFAFLGLLLMGLGFAPIYPCLMHETPRRFDRDTFRTVIGLQMASANLGGSIVPASLGLVGARFGLNAVVPCVGVLVIVLLALSERLNRTT